MTLSWPSLSIDFASSAARIRGLHHENATDLPSGLWVRALSFVGGAGYAAANSTMVDLNAMRIQNANLGLQQFKLQPDGAQFLTTHKSSSVKRPAGRQGPASCGVSEQSCAVARVRSPACRKGGRLKSVINKLSVYAGRFAPVYQQHARL